MKRVLFYLLFIATTYAGCVSAESFEKKRGNPEHLEELQQTGACVAGDLRDLDIVSALCDYQKKYENASWFQKFFLRKHINLKYANLENACLRGIVLNDVNFKGANLVNADLEGAWLSGNFSYANLTNANLSHTHIHSPGYYPNIFRMALRLPIRLFAIMFGSEFLALPTEISVPLGIAYIYYKGLGDDPFNKSNFLGANLTNADFIGSDLDFVKFTGANLYNANFKDSSIWFTRFPCANLTNANFTGSDLCFVKFTGANVYNANFTNSSMQRTRFYFANTVGAKINRNKIMLLMQNAFKRIKK